MEFRDIVIRILRKIYRLISRKKYLNPECIYDREQSNKLISEMLNSDKPCMISRFGTVEINAVNNYLVINKNKTLLKREIEYIIDHTSTPWWNRAHFIKMCDNAGIFPISIETANLFAEIYLEDIPQIDLLGSHQYFEKYMPLKEGIPKVQLELLYPFFVQNPWTKSLEGKKILVIHPFEETIKVQYKNRDKLFDNESVLPLFDLILYKSVQSIAGNCVDYDSWFDALEKMKKDISEIEFDIALIGCGAYGLPLAAHVKRIGKKSIHIGGGLQLLFGILGKRWVEQYSDFWEYRPNVYINTNYRKLFNEYWIYPLTEDTPKNSSVVEGSCYWK